MFTDQSPTSTTPTSTTRSSYSSSPIPVGGALDHVDGEGSEKKKNATKAAMATIALTLAGTFVGAAVTSFGSSIGPLIGGGASLMVGGIVTCCMRIFRKVNEKNEVAPNRA